MHCIILHCSEYSTARFFTKCNRILTKYYQCFVVNLCCNYPSLLVVNEQLLNLKLFVLNSVVIIEYVHVKVIMTVYEEFVGVYFHFTISKDKYKVLSLGPCSILLNSFKKNGLKLVTYYICIMVTEC